MSEPVKKRVKVLGAQYAHEAMCIVLQVRCEQGEFKTQIPLKSVLPNITNLNSFSESDLKEATKVFCLAIIGKEIMCVSDKELDEKLKDNHKLEY